MKNVELLNEEFGIDLDDMLGDIMSKVLGECATSTEGDKTLYTRIGVLIATEIEVDGDVKATLSKIGKGLFIDQLSNRLGHVCKRVQVEQIKPFTPYKG